MLCQAIAGLDGCPNVAITGRDFCPYHLGELGYGLSRIRRQSPSKFRMKEDLTETQKRTIKHLGEKPVVKEPKPKNPRSFYYNPNDYIQISPAEIEKQAQEALKQMMSHEDSLKLNQYNKEINREIKKRSEGSIDTNQL